MIVVCPDPGLRLSHKQQRRHWLALRGWCRATLRFVVPQVTLSEDYVSTRLPADLGARFREIAAREELSVSAELRRLIALRLNEDDAPSPTTGSAATS